VFPIYDAHACPTGLVGRHPGENGVRWLKQQTREVPYDMLKPVADAIGGFSLKHLTVDSRCAGKR